MFPSDADFDTKFTLEAEKSPLADEQAFHLLLLGDWSGRKSRSITSPPKYQPIEIDRDNFDDVIRKLNVELHLDFQGDDNSVLTLRFEELEDFHPDRIFQQLPIFDDLRDVRRQLVNKDTFNNAAAEVRSWLVDSNEVQECEATQLDEAPSAKSSSSDDLLDQILLKSNETETATRSQTGETSELNRFVKTIVQPHLIRTDMVEQSRLLLIVDEVISDLMRKILHHPQFQSLESAWRGAFLLVKRIETDAELKIFLMDLNKNELINDLKSTEDLTDAHLYKVFHQENAGLFNQQKWALVCGNYTFSLNVEDIAALIRLAKIAESANSPFISHLSSEIFGFESFGYAEEFANWKVSEDSPNYKLWNALRSVPETTHLGLALPRLLARLPYGEHTEPTEGFTFEEFTNDSNHEEYLWINPVFACGLLLAQTFRQFGWNISSNLIQDITNLPLHLFKNSDGNKAQPCAEITMNEKNYQQILDQGLIGLISFKDIDKVRLGRLQSVSSASSILKGSWS